MKNLLSKLNGGIWISYTRTSQNSPNSIMYIGVFFLLRKLKGGRETSTRSDGRRLWIFCRKTEWERAKNESTNKKSIDKQRKSVSNYEQRQRFACAAATSAARWWWQEENGKSIWFNMEASSMTRANLNGKLLIVNNLEIKLDIFGSTNESLFDCLIVFEQFRIFKFVKCPQPPTQISSCSCGISLNYSFFCCSLPCLVHLRMF